MVSNGIMEADQRVDGPSEGTSTNVKLPKKLIVCCDGTWMDSDNGWVKGKWGQPGHLQNPTNVTRICRAIATEDKGHHPQITYYQAGIGTGISLYNRLVGGGTGLGLAEHVREAYAFPALNYSQHKGPIPHDSIFLIGFSRGAYTARTLGGFICAMGILKRHAVPHFYEVFEDRNRAGDPHYRPMFFSNYCKHHRGMQPVWSSDKLANSKDPKNRDTYLEEYFDNLKRFGLTQDVGIRCIGVWDTVGALGIPINPWIQRMIPVLPSFIKSYRWFDTRLGDQVENGFQALALDEHRYPYSPAVWERRCGSKSNLKQVWFAGAHSNIGGSYADAGMANITLAWMMDQLTGNTVEHPEEFKHHDWIQFDEEHMSDWYDCHSDWTEDNKPAPYAGWARGKLYNSNTFPQSLAGSKIRSPGRFYPTDYDSGKEDHTRFLDDTNEFIHSSVRARIDTDGRDVETDWDHVFPRGWNITPILKHLWYKLTGLPKNVYRPQRKGQPLADWQLTGDDESLRKPSWRSSNASDDGHLSAQWNHEADHDGPSVTLLEAKLGKFEKMLLLEDKVMAAKVDITQDGWRWKVGE